MRKILPVVIATALALAACGGGDSNDDAFRGTGGTGGGGTGGGGAAGAVSLGSGSGAGFQAQVIGISNATLSAGGSTSLQVALQRADGTLVTESATIAFSSPCTAQRLAQIDSPITTTTGVATATYRATGCSGDDVITASTTFDSRQLSATGTVRVAAAAIGSIVFDSATPTNIALRGTGGAGRPETSTVVFRVVDQSGGPRANADVTFALNTQVGGITFTPATARSDANGRVQTVVQAGTVATSVRVTGTVQNVTPAISNQSSQLTITTGIPDQDSFSLAVRCQNVEAWNLDGVRVEVTARLADRFNNPVPDGTAVTFSAEGGIIQSQCNTGTTPTESGVCLVNWTSANPRPGGGLGQAGRVSLLATAIGEESFTDANGNGRLDNGEAFVDLGERFMDANESGTYDVGEQIYDFNNNSNRDPADGIFNGVLCSDTTGRCSTAAGATSTGIGVSNLIIMSDGTPSRVLPASGTSFNVTRGGGGLITLRLADLNDNPLPSGTTVAGTVTGTGLTLGQPSSFTVPCTTSPTSVTFNVTASATAANGSLSVLVTAPSGLQTILTYPIIAN
jgi:hypothetical protein